MPNDPTPTRAELAEAKRRNEQHVIAYDEQAQALAKAEAARDRYAAVIAYNYLDGAPRPDHFRKTIDEACEWYAHHRAKQEKGAKP